MSQRVDYYVHLPLSWIAFRIAELRAAAEATSVDLTISEDDEAALHARPDSVLLRISVPDEASLVRLASRTVLAKSFIDVWASGDDWDSLAAQLLAYPRELAAPYLAEGTTFRVNVSSLGRSQSNEDRMGIIQKLEPLLPWCGKVNLKAAQHTFVCYADTPNFVGADGTPNGIPLTEAPTRFYFGRMVAEGRRDLVGKYDLKKRNYIGTTSLDAELSLLMANLARVRPADLVYDPYCGTAGTLVAAAAFGARVLGCDLNLPALRGELRTRSGPSKLKQDAVQGIPHTFAAYGLPLPLGVIHGDSGAHLAFLRSPPGGSSTESGGSGGGGGGGGLFDAIITDPPYGIREKPSEVDDARLLSRTLPPAHAAGHVPHRALASIEKILSDLFSLAARTLKPGGRLVFLLPTTEPFSAGLLPPHPSLVLEAASEQTMAARWSRWCVSMVREGHQRHTDDGARGGVPLPSVAIHHASTGVPPRGGASASAPANPEGEAASAGGDGAAPIFNRASLRPDDMANRLGGSAAATAVAASTVLHPHLLGKSAGARKRLEKRLARAAKSDAMDGDESGSRRSERRRARNQGRGEYEESVRARLAMVSGRDGDGPSGTATGSGWSSWATRVAGVAAIALLMGGSIQLLRARASAAR
jgi:tRNA (guanine10-N2)-methyltransferase